LQEYKEQAVHFKREGKLAEAAAALRLYKQVLAMETRAKAAEQRKEYTRKMQQEAHFAAQQARMFSFYERFVDKELGRAQVVAWQDYGRQCAAAASNAENTEDKLEPGNLERKTASNLKEIRETDLSFIGKTCDPAEERIEVCPLEGIDFQTNKHLRDVLGIAKDFKGEFDIPAGGSIRVVATAQLPASMEYPDDNVQLEYVPVSQAEGRYIFGGSQYLNAERGSTRFAKLLVRRIGRKRITFDVFHVSVKKGIFSRSSEENLLGTAVVELKDLLRTNVIAGDFPLFDVTRRHELGGFLRIAIRTSSPFVQEESKKSEEEPMSATTGLSSTVARITQYPSFIFKE
jgi:hypothetical protein